MDWVHCNMCFMQPGDIAGRKFSLTNCGHIYCAECLRSGQIQECHICHVKYNTIPLTTKMSPDVEVYFHDPVQNIQQQVKILEFQQSHRIRLVTFLRSKLTSYKDLKKEYVTCKEDLKCLKLENESLKQDMERKTKELDHFKKKCKAMLQYCQSKQAQESPTNSTCSTPNNLSQPATKKPMFSVGNDVRSLANQNIILKRPTPQNFFLMSDTKASQQNEKLFATPNPPKFSGDYRNVINSTPIASSPLTPDSFVSNYSQKDPLQRKIKLPGDKGGPSPATKIGLHRLSLSRQSSTPLKASPVVNKYSKYF